MNGKVKYRSAVYNNAIVPLITKRDLERTWIGLGVAVDWITMRGQPMSNLKYYAQYDEAAEALIDLLADTPPEIAESVVRGAAEDKQGPLIAIPSGIWRQTAPSDFRHGSRPYRLVCVDDEDEWEGGILGVHVTGYRKVQIRSDFILDAWPEQQLAIQPSKSRRVVARADVRRMIEHIIAQTPDDLRSLSQFEIIQLVRRLMPEASRDVVREFVRDVLPVFKTGPRGRRNPDRKSRISEFGEKLLAAKLHN